MSSRRLLVFDALQPLSGEDERLLCDNFTFMMTARKLEKVDLETALKVVPHFPIWLVPKNEGDLFKRCVEDLHSSRQPAHGSREIPPAAPDIDTLRDDSLFDDDSMDDEYTPAVSMESRAGDTAGESPRRLDPSNSALVVVHDRGYREGCGQLSQDDSHEIPRSGSKLVSPNTFGIVASGFGESASPTMEHRAPTGNDSTGVGSTAPPAAKVQAQKMTQSGTQTHRREPKWIVPRSRPQKTPRFCWDRSDSSHMTILFKYGHRQTRRQRESGREETMSYSSLHRRKTLSASGHRLLGSRS